MRACVCYDSMCVHIHVCMCGCVCMCVFHDSEKDLSCDSYFVCHKTQDGLDVFFLYLVTHLSVMTFWRCMVCVAGQIV